MLTAETQPHEIATPDIPAAAIREQLELLVQDASFRSSKRSVQFLRYVVQQTLDGAGDQIKERTIGVEVFGRDPSYDTNLDHVVRTAAIELRKRLAIYYGDEKHKSELRMSLVPGSYKPRFSLSNHGASAADLDPATAHLTDTIPTPAEHPGPVLVTNPAAEAVSTRWRWYVGVSVCLIAACALLGYSWTHRATAQDLFWKPVLETPGFVLLAAGDVPDGPPTASADSGEQGSSLPIVHKTSSPTIPFADAMTMARVSGTLESHGKKVVIRQEGASSFSDLREGPVVLIGAFNNEWSLRLTRKLRFSLALDPAQHLVYIKDAKNPSGRTWSWRTDQPTDHQGAAGGPALQDYALISRVWNSETGHAVIIIGGLYTYGTEASGEFLTDPQMMQAISKEAALQDVHSTLQIVLGTTVTDGTAGPPKVLAVATE